MSLTEVELLSVYSGSNVDRQSVVSMLSVNSPILEEPPRTPPRTCELDRSVADSDCTPISMCTPTATQMRRSYCSEDNLLSTTTRATMLSKKEGGRSLPDITRSGVTVTQRCCEKPRRNGVKHSLTKLPRRIFNRLRHPWQSNRKRSELTSPNSTPLRSPPQLLPFQVLELTDEPRKLTDTGVASFNYKFKSEGEQTPLTPEGEADRGLIPVKPDLRLTYVGAHLDVHGPDSAIHSPTSTLSSQCSTRRKEIYRYSMDSGSGSFRSETTCSNRPFYTRRPSVDSADSVSMDSTSAVPYIPMPTKRGSYSSHNYVNLNLECPIYEDPDDDIATPEQVHSESI